MVTLAECAAEQQVYKFSTALNVLIVPLVTPAGKLKSKDGANHA